MSEPTPILLEFVQYPEDGEPLVVGKAELLPDGQLRLTAARDSHRNRLGHAVAEINAKETLAIEVPPLPGSPRFAVASRRVARSDDDFLDALQEHFRKYYKLELEDVSPA